MKKTASIIIPADNEEENIPLLCERLKDIAVTSDHLFEFVFVDDGSRDRTFPLLMELSAKDDV
jgi:glycosyltransferase involved in cell wall biosynthesis